MIWVYLMALISLGPVDKLLDKFMCKAVLMKEQNTEPEYNIKTQQHLKSNQVCLTLMTAPLLPRSLF